MTIDRTSLIPQQAVLSNGQPVALFYDKAINILRIDVTFEAGTAYQHKKLVSGLTNSLISEGTRRHTSREIAEFMDFRGIIMERSIETYTSTVSVYLLRKYAEELLPLLYEILTEPIFPEEEFNVLLARRRQTLQTNFQKTRYVARNLFYEKLYGFNHVMGGYAVESDCDKISVEDVRQFYKEHYTLSNAHYVLSGGCDKEIIDLFDRYFGHETYNPNPLKTIEKELPPLPTEPLFQSIPNTVQSTLRVGRILPFRWDSIDYVRFLILSTTLGGYFGSRLMQNIREDKGYTYGINSQTQLDRGTITFFIVSDVNANDAEAAMKEIDLELRRLCDAPIDKEELERVQNYMRGDFIRSIDGTFEHAERYRQMYSTCINEQFTENYLNVLEECNPAVLQELAREILSPEKQLHITVGK